MHMVKISVLGKTQHDSLLHPQFTHSIHRLFEPLCSVTESFISRFCLFFFYRWKSSNLDFTFNSIVPNSVTFNGPWEHNQDLRKEYTKQIGVQWHRMKILRHLGSICTFHYHLFRPPFYEYNFLLLLVHPSLPANGPVSSSLRLTEGQYEIEIWELEAA